jgi:esterase/lipase
METEYIIHSSDNHLVYGLLNSQKETNKLIIFVNGLGVTKELHTGFNSARYFPKHGFDTFRFDFFSNKEKGRLLSDCSITTFTEDLNSVIKKFDKKYDQIYLVGASLGGCAVINSNQKNIEKIVLWDGALFPKNPNNEYNKKFTWIESLNKYLISGSIQYLVSKELVNERSKQNEDIIANIKKPIKLIMAEKFHQKDRWKQYLSLIKVPYEFIIIKNASHGFDEEGVEEQLFEETLIYLNKRE